MLTTNSPNASYRHAIRAYSTELDLGWVDETFPVPVRKTTLFSGDLDLIPSVLPDLLRRFPDMAAADWESGAIAYVAKVRATPLLILRAVPDLVSPEAGEARDNMALFESRAAAVVGMPVDDPRRVIPYVLRRLR